MIHLNDVFQEDLEIWSKSPGLPWKDLGYKTKGDIKRDPEAIRRVRYFWHLVKAGHHLTVLLTSVLTCARFESRRYVLCGDTLLQSLLVRPCLLRH